MAVVNQYNIPPAMADIVTTWAFLEEGVDHIMTKQNTPLPSFKYYSMYTVCYNYCTSVKLKDITWSGQSAAGRSGVKLMGSDLYSCLVRYFAQHLRHLRDYSASLQDEFLLKYYAAEWDRYTTGANYINRLFAYLNQNWVKRERVEGRKSVYPIYTLALVQWHANVVHYIQGRRSNLTGAILRLIERQRNGETIDQGLLKKVVDSFVSLGIDEIDLNNASLDCYKEHFEIPFLVATEAYYECESDSFVVENSVSDYLKKAEERLEEEEDRAERCLHPTTRRLLITKCEHVLVRTHADLMWENFQSLLEYDKYEDLQRMYSLLSRIPEGLGPLRRNFEEHVKRTGLAAVSELVGTDSTAIETIEPKAYVDALLQVHSKSSETVNRSFEGDADFVASLDRACREFVNCNAATGNSPSRSPELLAKYADALLRKNNVSDEGDLEGALNRVIVIFKYMEEKDVFQTFYSTNLSKRLIHGVSASDDAESSMISKLKEACGVEYTCKLQRMFTDMSLSKDLTDSFKELMEPSHNDINFSVMVLGTNFWHLNPPKGGFIVPTEIRLTYHRFQNYYRTTHPGRKLMWLWNYSRNELRTNYLDQKYIITTSAYQMAVLLQYNDNDTYSLDELAVATSIGKDLLTQVLQPLVKSRILIDEGADQYDLNSHFKSRKIRVNLDRPMEAELEAESIGVLKTVDEGRNYVIQAAIIRIMKARKTISHRSLIEEVISQTSLRFTPQTYDIKKAIDILIQNQYIERVNDMWDSYVYVP